METKIYDDQLIVITGSAGLIGSAVVKQLNSEGFSNLLLVDAIGKTDKWKNLLHKQFVDLIHPNALFDWLKGKEKEIEAFIHLGACSDTTETDGDYILDNNFRYSTRLVEYALENDHRFVYASSAATYGNGSQGFSDDHSMLESLEPLNLYGYSKHLFDLWLLRQGILDQVVGLKYFNIFGPNEQHKGKMASMVMHMTRQIADTGKVRLFQSNDPKNYSDGDQKRDFYYVKDAARMTCLFLQNDLGGIFNVGRGEPKTWNELACATFSALGIDPNIEYIPAPQELSHQYQNYTCADMSKFKRAMQDKGLALPEEHSLEEGVADYVQNHLMTARRW